MKNWLQQTLDLFSKSFNNIEEINYKNIIFIFYEHLSNRNLAVLIANVFDKEELDVYFEIDNIINKKLYDEEQVKALLKELNKNGFQEWIDLEE